MDQTGLNRLQVCLDAEIARARLEILINEADDVTVLWIGAIVGAATGGLIVPTRPLQQQVQA